MPVIDSFPRLVTALILAAACAVSACDRSAPRTDPVEAADSGGVAVVAELADLERPMPLVDQTSFDADLVDLLYMGLTRGAWREGRLVSQLADENPMAMALGWRCRSS